MADGFRVLITDRAWPDSQIEQEILREVGAEVLDAPDASESTLLDLASGVDAIAACWAQVTLRLLDAAPNCRIVARFGIGLDNIPVDACTQRHIPVTFVPDYCIPEVADHTIALLLSAVRKTAFFHLNTKQGEYQLAAGPPLRRLSGLTLGLVGLGRIARAVVPRARALGLNVVARFHARSILIRPSTYPDWNMKRMKTMAAFHRLHQEDGCQSFVKNIGVGRLDTP